MNVKIDSIGELNYLITCVIKIFVSKQEKVSYALYNSIIGAIESVKLEYYRRIVALYEEKKKEENGDVY